MLISIQHWNLQVCGERLLNKSPVNFFCSTSLPLASTRWVRLTFSSLCQLFWAVPSINLSNIKRQIFGSACPWSDPATPSPVNITCHLFGLAQVRKANNFGELNFLINDSGDIYLSFALEDSLRRARSKKSKFMSCKMLKLFFCPVQTLIANFGAKVWNTNFTCQLILKQKMY